MMTGKGQTVCPVSRRTRREHLGNYRLACLTSVFRKTMEKILLEAVSKQIKNKDEVRNS